MFKKMVFLAAIMLLGLTANALAGWALWQGSVSDDWADPANWVQQNQTTPLGRVPNADSDMVGIGTAKTNHWPVLYNNNDHFFQLYGVTGYEFDGSSQLFAMSEWTGVYSKLTFEGGILFQPNDQYFIVGRHNTDTADLIINDGGIGVGFGDWDGKTRWLRIGRGDSTGGGRATMVMNGGAVYAQAMSIGNPDGTGDAGSSATINGGNLYVGGGYGEAQFDIAANASMTINPGGNVEMDSQAMWDGARAEAKGALNIVADGTGSGRLVIPWVVTTAEELRAYFGWDDGAGGITLGNVNAIYNGGAGQFNFVRLTGIFTEITVIPEPATVALLGIGGLCLLRRKHS